MIAQYMIIIFKYFYIFNAKIKKKTLPTHFIISFIFNSQYQICTRFFI